MSKQKKTTAIPKGATRPERWAIHARARIEELRDNGNKIPAEWFEEIEGRPLTDVVVDQLINERGLGKIDPAREWNQKTARLEDESLERAGTRLRNSNERSCAHYAVDQYLFGVAKRFVGRDALHDFIRAYYRAGDYGLDAALRRAVADAMGANGRQERATA